MPTLSGEEFKEFYHIGREESFQIKTPIKEELFANKWCTMLYRGSSRDLYDVYQIMHAEMDFEVFRKCSVIDSLMCGRPKLYEIDAESLVETIPIDDTLRNLLRKRETPPKIREKVTGFTQQVLKDLSSEEIELIDKFYEKKEFNPEKSTNMGYSILT
ncbi:MAG: nucleotidyl transferase AbiEii/AbiGii toxin family protein [Candidatus Hydrothermarchaeota archaeon]